MKWRIISVIIFFAVIYSFLIFNIYKLQVVKHDQYVAQAENQNISNGLLAAPRGGIFFTDKSGAKIPAAVNKDYPEIFAVPHEIQTYYGSSTKKLRQIIQSDAEKLSGILGIAADDLKTKLSKKNDEYEFLIDKATPDQLTSIKEANLKGIYIRNKSLRYYPYADLASQVLGFVSPANDTESARVGNAEIGRYGAELYFEKELSGSPGRVIGDSIIRGEDGRDIVLTIDPTIQGEAEDILQKLIEQYRAAGGSVIVEEPKTGKILAMDSIPNFDPNNYSKFNISSFMNPAVQGVYEPGSIFKVITMSAGIDSGKITPETTYYDTGSFTANGKTITNWDFKTHGAYGAATMTNVIEHSINTGAVFAEKKTGHDLFYNYLIKFGINSVTHITLPGEVKGSLNSLKHGRDINFATASYGQGVSVTPLELVSAISAIANGGLLMEPYVLASGQPEVIRRVISEDTSQKVTQMMASAVYKNKVAVIPNYSIAAKTGTAFIPDFKKGGYTGDVVNTYVGFGPTSDPKFIILIKLDKPAGSPLAGETVIPAFKELAQFIINYLNIPPDNLPANKNN